VYHHYALCVACVGFVLQLLSTSRWVCFVLGLQSCVANALLTDYFVQCVLISLHATKRWLIASLIYHAKTVTEKIRTINVDLISMLHELIQCTMLFLFRTGIDVYNGCKLAVCVYHMYVCVCVCMCYICSVMKCIFCRNNKDRLKWLYEACHLMVTVKNRKIERKWMSMQLWRYACLALVTLSMPVFYMTYITWLHVPDCFLLYASSCFCSKVQSVSSIPVFLCLSHVSNHLCCWFTGLTIHHSLTVSLVVKITRFTNPSHRRLLASLRTVITD